MIRKHFASFVDAEYAGADIDEARRLKSVLCRSFDASEVLAILQDIEPPRGQVAA